jgi:cyclic beta-1,2-glucan synthetase
VVENPHHVCRGIETVELDGKSREEKTILLQDDGAQHTLRIQMGPGEKHVV